MTIHVKCKCGVEHEMPDDWAGKRGKCPDCGRILRVPRPRRRPAQAEAPPPEPEEEAPQSSTAGAQREAPTEEDFVPFQMSQPEEEEFEDGLKGRKKDAATVTDVKVKDNILNFKCPCGKALRAPVSKAGKTARCPGCKTPVTIPEPPEEEPEPVFDYVREEDAEIFECANCGEKMDKASIICVKCGTHRITGDTMETKTGEDAFADEKGGLKKALGKVSFWKRKETEE